MIDLLQKKNIKETNQLLGLAPIICYEPWFPRTLESIKQSLNDGNSVLVRLHSAASYPIKSDLRYSNDLTSHAVLIVGYDDIKEEVAVIDPWNKKWGGNTETRRSISYSELSIMHVDCSLGNVILLAPMQIDAKSNRDDSGNLFLNIEIGFYTPRGAIMDLNSFKINNVQVKCNFPKLWKHKPIDFSFEGEWIVGSPIKKKILISQQQDISGEIEMEVVTNIEGKRPYYFEESISHKKTISIEASSILEKTEAK